MVNHQGYPRRKQAAQGRRKLDSERQSACPTDSTSGVATREALDVAAYVSDMTAQLEAMAQTFGLDLLSYFLGMSRSEADLFIRTNAGPEAEDKVEESDEGPELSDEDQAEFGGPEG